MAGRKEVRKMVIAIVTEATTTTTSHANQWGSSVRLERAFKMIWREMSFPVCRTSFRFEDKVQVYKTTLLTFSVVWIDAVCCR